MQGSPWGLRQTPFGARPDRALFFASASCGEALARLHFLVDERRRLGLVLGPAGGGKSMLLAVLANELRRAAQPVALINAIGLTADEGLHQIATQWGLTPRANWPTIRLWQAVTDRLYENRCQKLTSVVLVDDADEAEPALRTVFERLAVCETSPEARFTIILAAHADRLEYLSPRVRELAELRIDLEPWEPDDTAQYVRTALEQAGATTEPFSSDALARLHTLTDGLPRRINALADLALLAGASAGASQIDAELVDQVHRELLVGA